AAMPHRLVARATRRMRSGRCASGRPPRATSSSASASPMSGRQTARWNTGSRRRDNAPGELRPSRRPPPPGSRTDGCPKSPERAREAIPARQYACPGLNTHTGCYSTTRTLRKKESVSCGRCRRGLSLHQRPPNSFDRTRYDITQESAPLGGARVCPPPGQGPDTVPEEVTVWKQAWSHGWNGRPWCSSLTLQRLGSTSTASRLRAKRRRRERVLAKHKVVGSTPITRSQFLGKSRTSEDRS